MLNLIKDKDARQIVGGSNTENDCSMNRQNCMSAQEFKQRSEGPAFQTPLAVKEWTK